MGGFERLMRIEAASRPGADPFALAFDRQRDAILSVMPPGARCAWLCGRRAGKTRGVLLLAAIIAREHPGCVIPYLALTRTSAERILWAEIKALNLELGLGLRYNETDLIATFPNGSALTLLGANQASEIEKLRGQKYPLVAIDEVASFRPSLLDYLVTDVLEPALLDMDGRLLLVGTPGAALVGPFYNVTTGGRTDGEWCGWTVSRWTCLDNPHIPDVAARLEKLRLKRGWTLDTPVYRREYLGQWVRDEESLVYPVRDRNLCTYADLPELYAEWLSSDQVKPPPRGWAHILAADFGVVNANALAVWAYQTTPGAERTAWLVETRAVSGQLVTEAAADVHAWWERYRVQAGVGDAGGLGKPYLDLVRSRFGLMLMPADKRGKLAHIDVFGAMLTSGNVKIIIDRNREFLEQAALLQWDTKAVAIEVGGRLRHEDRKQEDPRFANDLCDAALYGYMKVREYLTPIGKSEPDPSTDPLEQSRLNRRTEASWLAAQNKSRIKWGQRR